MFYIDSFFVNNSINLNSNSLGKIFKNFLHNEENPLNKEEEFLFNYIVHLNKERFLRKSKASKQAWENKQNKEQKEKQIQQNKTNYKNSISKADNSHFNRIQKI